MLGMIPQSVPPGYVGVFGPTQFSALNPADYAAQYVAVERDDGSLESYRSDGLVWAYVGLLGDTQGRALPEILIGNTGSSLRRQRLAPAPVGFNSYELLYRWIIDDTYDYEALLAYFGQCNVNFVRILFPVFHAEEWETFIFADESIPTGELTDADFEPAFLTKTDAVFSAASAANVKLLLCLFWETEALAELFSESVIDSLKTTSATYDFMLRFVRWFGRRYGEHAALGAYSFFCEQPYDTSGVSEPTPADLGAVNSGLTAEMRLYAPLAVATTDLNPLTLMVEAGRPTFVSEMGNLRTVFAGCDAVGVHVYGYGPTHVGTSFVGFDGAVTAAFGPSTTNQLGFEALEGYLSSMRSVADSLGVPLWLTEVGVPTDVETPASSLRRSKLLSICQKYAEVTLIWNVADVAEPAPNQVVWQIVPGSTLGNTYKSLVLGLNAGRVPPAAGGLGAGTTPLRMLNRPKVCMTSTRTAGATVQALSTAAMASSTQGWLAWVRRNAPLNNFEVLFDCRHTHGSSEPLDHSGFVYLAGADAGDDPEFAEFPTTGGGLAGNTSGLLPRIADSEWYHIAVFFRRINGQLGIEVWQNGLLFGAFAAAAAYGGTRAAEPIFVLGGSSSGAPVSMQDVAMVPYASPEDLWAHMAGAVLPQSQLHLRADATGAIRDLSANRLPITVGVGVITEVA